jgi:predicted  nucleic acid-binding Zn-ribbon protein
VSRLRVRDHENATTAASERLVKEKDDLQSQVKRLDKEIVTLKKQLVGAKFKIGNLDKGWKVERESAEQSQNAMQAVKAQLDVAQAEVEAIRLQLQQKQAELDTATTEHKAALEAKTTADA